MIHRFETPERLRELDPPGTLKKLGLKKGDVFCDIGAGTGIFTIAAAHITENTTYAVDVSDEMLGIIADKIKKEDLSNIQLIRPEGFEYPIPDGACDMVFLCAAFHHIGGSPLLVETRRILKKGGKLVMIEFYKRVTPHGPPPEFRISQHEITELASESGFVLLRESSLSDNYYLVEYRPV